MANEAIAAFVLSVVRGEAPLRQIYERELAFQLLDVPVSWRDIAIGFLHYADVGGDSAYDWAGWMIADANSTSFPEAEPFDADALLDGVWDLAFREPVSDEAVRAARRLLT